MKIKRITTSSIVLMVVFIFLVGFQKLPNDKWLAPVSADKIMNPIKNDSKATASGKKLYQAVCAVCHGPKGKGDGIAATGLTPKPANLTSVVVQLQTDGAIFWKIEQGRTPMPSYKTAIPEQNRWQIINYIRTLKK